MDYETFTSIVNWITDNGYTHTLQTTDNEIYYGKTKSLFESELDINSEYDYIKFPQVNYDIYSNDFVIITTQIYNEVNDTDETDTKNKIQICIDTDECKFTDDTEIIDISISNSRQRVNIKKYFSQTFIDYKIDNSDFNLFS
jgi:hypothetical protein